MFSKKVFKNKVLNFGTIKVLWKSPWNKKLVEIKSYYFQTDFQGLFSSSNIIWYKKVPGKKSYKSRKWKVTRDFYSHAKKGLVLKHPWLYSICRCIQEKSFYWKRLRLDLIFTRLWTIFLVFFFGYFVFRSLVSVILFPEALLTPS